ncbi:hypothetical protein [Brachybacterium sp.]|uniref:hypothetical protein n=1 Tax=unclassified Brachybacterium TaxID=2623841 RepID=UPI003F9584DE
MSIMQHGTGSTADATRDGAAATAEAALAAPAAETTDAPVALTSLTSLLGGTIQGGTSCEVDGTCD